MEAIKLRELVLEFVDASVDSIQMVTDDTEEFMTRNEVLASWTQLPDCQLTQMFLGYALAKGVDINDFTPEELDLAVQTALVGDDGVDFDWLGGCDATSKPH